MATAYASISPIGASTATVEEARFSWDDSTQRNSYFGLLALTGLLTYSFWRVLEATSAFWNNDQYSHGWIVPMIALYLMWTMRPNPDAQAPPEGVAEETFLGMMPASVFGRIACGAGAAVMILGTALTQPWLQGLGLGVICLGGLAYVLIGQPFHPVSTAQRWAGLGVLLVAYALHIHFGANLYMEPVSRLAFVAALIGGFMMVGGLPLLRWTGAGLGFLLFMYPLPTFIEGQLLLFLQKLAAIASEMVLTILSQPVVRQGNTISVDGIPLEVAEACSGLRMVTIFGGFAVACALLMKRPWWDKLIVLLSAIPIALIVNITRIVATALLFRLAAGPEGQTLLGWDMEAIQQQFHDLPGYLMMFMAMGLLGLELKILRMLSVQDEGIDMGHSSFGGSPGAMQPGIR